jgi:plastocyanin
MRTRLIGITTSAFAVACIAVMSSGAAGAAAGGKPSGTHFHLAANPSGQLSYDKKKLVAPKAGKVTIQLRNPSPLSHDVAVRGPNGARLGKSKIESHGRVHVSLNLHRGRYRFYCTVPGHREAGMTGQLIVK